MRKVKKRKPDLRRIRTSKIYKVPEIARDLDRNVATVRSWLRDGLPTLDGQTPPLVFGSDLKDWLKAKWAARKQKCKPDELYCFKCQKPRKPGPGTVQIVPRNEKTLSIKGECSECGTRLNRVGSMAEKAEIEEIFRALAPAMQHLTGCSIPCTRRTSEADGKTGPKSIERNTTFNNEEARL